MLDNRVHLRILVKNINNISGSNTNWKYLDVHALDSQVLSVFRFRIKYSKHLSSLQ
jgi:hypothetical protein